MNTIIVYITIFSFLLVFIFLGRIIFNHKRREFIIKNFDSYSAVLQYHMDKAYNIIHKDQILIYSLEATTLPDVEFNKATLDFIKLVEKMLGPTLTKEMIFVYGDYNTLTFNLAEYFNTRYDEDEIRKSALSEVMESEGQPEGSNII
jgi:hypothetical protein